MGKLGTLQQISPDKTSVLIDGVWYNAAACSKYIPDVGSQIEYNVDEQGALAFIRSKTAFTPKKTKGAYVPKNTVGAPTSAGDSRTESIIKQVIFKVAGNLAGGFTYGAAEEAVANFDEIYQRLADKYRESLK